MDADAQWKIVAGALMMRQCVLMILNVQQLINNA
jgi:hypothetical protein